jgi:hypothetical protein
MISPLAGANGVARQSSNESADGWPAYVQLAYLVGEIAAQSPAPQLQAPQRGRRFHLHCSKHNPGAMHAAQELRAVVPSLRVTEEQEHLAKRECEHMLVYLTSDTWTRGKESDALAAEICTAIECGVHRLLVHEVEGGRERDERYACSLSETMDATPEHLVQAGIYDEVATSLGCGEWRHTGLIKLAQRLANGPVESAPSDAPPPLLAPAPARAAAPAAPSAARDEAASGSAAATEGASAREMEVLKRQLAASRQEVEALKAQLALARGASSLGSPPSRSSPGAAERAAGSMRAWVSNKLLESSQVLSGKERSGKAQSSRYAPATAGAPMAQTASGAPTAQMFCESCGDPVKLCVCAFGAARKAGRGAGAPGAAGPRQDLSGKI